MAKIPKFFNLLNISSLFPWSQCFSIQNLFSSFFFQEQELFFFHELSPGSCFFQPKGAHIYNKLVRFMQEEYWKRGFQVKKFKYSNLFPKTISLEFMQSLVVYFFLEKRNNIFFRGNSSYFYIQLFLKYILLILFANPQEVISPNMYNARLWMTSGHWEHYSDDMFKIDVDKEQFGLKPMNCPGHCLVRKRLFTILLKESNFPKYFLLKKQNQKCNFFD